MTIPVLKRAPVSNSFRLDRPKFDPAKRDAHAQLLYDKAKTIARGQDVLFHGTRHRERVLESGVLRPSPAHSSTSCKPKGTRHRATILAEELINGSGELLVKKCVEMALGGDAAAMRLVMERLCPPRRERPVSLDMPSIKSASDLISAAAALTDAVAGGDITPGEAASLSTLVANTAKAVETFELAERLTRLEEQTAAKGGTP
jgi:hypothetical protein